MDSRAGVLLFSGAAQLQRQLTVVKLEDKEMAGRRSETPHIRPSLQSAEFPNLVQRGECLLACIRVFSSHSTTVASHWLAGCTDQTMCAGDATASHHCG